MIAALVLAVLVAPDAAPVVEGLPVVLRWSAVESCPTERALRSDVQSLAGAPIIAVNVAPLRVSMTVRTWERVAAEATTPPKPEVSELEPEPERELEPEPRSPRTPNRAGDWSHQFIAGGLADLGVGTAPVVSGVLSGWAGYAYGPFRIELSGQHAFATT